MSKLAAVEESHVRGGRAESRHARRSGDQCAAFAGQRVTTLVWLYDKKRRPILRSAKMSKTCARVDLVSFAGERFAVIDFRPARRLRGIGRIRSIMSLSSHERSRWTCTTVNLRAGVEHLDGHAEEAGGLPAVAASLPAPKLTVLHPKQ